MSLPRRAPLVAAALLLLVAAAAAALLLTADGSNAQRATRSVLPLPDGWQPEGIANGPGNAVYVGSIPTGARPAPRRAHRHGAASSSRAEPGARRSA